jgi:hypothetical protein
MRLRVLPKESIKERINAKKPQNFFQGFCRNRSKMTKNRAKSANIYQFPHVFLVSCSNCLASANALARRTI